jgi:hypothetical protein
MATTVTSMLMANGDRMTAARGDAADRTVLDQAGSRLILNARDARQSGRITFDERVKRMVPAALSYVDGEQTIKQVFVGAHAVEPAKG